MAGWLVQTTLAVEPTKWFKFPWKPSLLTKYICTGKSQLHPQPAIFFVAWSHVANNNKKVFDQREQAARWGGRGLRGLAS
jgi:hypothetical protein